MVFYNRLLRCFVLIDTKIEKLKHQDLGANVDISKLLLPSVKTEDALPILGIILCKGKKDAMVEITLSKYNRRIFAKSRRIEKIN